MFCCEFSITAVNRKQSVYPYITKSSITPSIFHQPSRALLLDLRTQLFYFNFIRNRKNNVKKKENCWSSYLHCCFYIHVQAHFAGKFIIYWKFFSSPELFYPLASPLSNTIRFFNTSYFIHGSIFITVIN